MKKDTQTLLLVFLGTLLLAGGILFFFFYDPFEPSVAPPVPPVNDTLVEEDPMEEDTPPLTDYPQNPTAQKLKEAIEKLRNASWDKPTFENLEFEVKNAFKSKLIDQATYELFQKRLHLNYLVSLKREVDQVITNSTSLSDLAAPHRELKAQAQAGQRNKVANHLRKSSAVYGLYNLTKELRERIDSGELKEDALQSYAEKIEAYPKREMFNNSKLVKTLSDSGMEKLKQFWSQQGYVTASGPHLHLLHHF
jgi:ATP-dependent Lon protease